ncbi:exported hypothetical protein [uncultured Desulfatiglans sp.]|uniref:Uncharacterized protein n=1 Tax=Uncultured Desulfatiglans sp. TaxID=1748965 RepID=A0A653A8V3_UNCDX|nr:exported hypothetical protein [uncultured Desulfatiglans sp.]
MRIFLYTLRVLSLTLVGRIPVSLHAARAQYHPCGAGPRLANIKEIKHLRGGVLQVAAQANMQIDAEISQKDHLRMETSVDPAPLLGQPEAQAKPFRIVLRV